MDASRICWINRLTAWCGMGFGSTVAMGCLVTAAIVFGPQHVKVDTYEQAAQMFVPVYGRWAVTLFALSLGIGCFGAAVEIALNAGYVLGQAFGWTWGIDKKRRDVSRFVTAFSVVLLLGRGDRDARLRSAARHADLGRVDGRHHAARRAAISRAHE